MQLHDYQKGYSHGRPGNSIRTSNRRSKELDDRPYNQTLLQLYELCKQATVGDVVGKRPGLTNMVGRAKYKAWKEMKGISSEDAMQVYIKLVTKLKG